LTPDERSLDDDLVQKLVDDPIKNKNIVLAKTNQSKLSFFSKESQLNKLNMIEQKEQNLS